MHLVMRCMMRLKKRMFDLKTKIFSSPYIVWMSIFVIVPLALVFYFAFTSSSGSFTFENIFNVGEYSEIFLRSIWLGAIATVICLILGYPVAYIISMFGQIKQKNLILLLMLPMWMNFLLRTYAWMTLLENNGLINKFLDIFEIGPFSMINTQGAVVVGMVYNFLPYMILPIYSVVQKLPVHAIEAAQDLGANSIDVFLKVVLPLSLSGIISGITMVFVPAVSTFVISKMLGGGANLLIGDLIEMKFLGNSYNPHLGSALSLVLMILILICMGIMNQFDGRLGRQPITLKE